MRAHVLPLTLPSPPVGERDRTKMATLLSSLSPIGGEGRVRGRTMTNARQ
jgi:hypothetical protein